MANKLLFNSTTLLLLFTFFTSTQSAPFRFPTTTTSSSTGLRRSIHRQSNFSVADFGAVGDGTNYDTPHIQAAIDACHRAGGGTVIFPKGKYLTATIYLKSGVTLDVKEEAVILAGTKIEDYPLESRRWYLILAENATDVGITGYGSVNGQGRKFVVKEDDRKNVMVSWNQTGACTGDECRPRLVGFVGCQNVRVVDILLTQSAYWCLHLVRCDQTYIYDIAVYSDFNNPNNDAIDITDSNNTVIDNCYLDTGDDGICPKTANAPLHNLTVTNTSIRTKSSAIKLGSQSWYDFKNLVFDGITIEDSHRGLALQLRDGGNASNIVFSNIIINTRYYDPSWWGRGEPIYITSCPRDSNSKVSSISNVLFTNITAHSENGIFLSGSSEGLLTDIKFVNVNLTYGRWTNYTAGLVDYRPGCRGLVNHSSAGIIVEYVDGLEIENMNMKWSREHFKWWDNPLDFNPSTVNRISLKSFTSGVYDQL